MSAKTPPRWDLSNVYPGLQSAEFAADFRGGGNHDAFGLKTEGGSGKREVKDHNLDFPLPPFDFPLFPSIRYDKVLV